MKTFIDKSFMVIYIYYKTVLSLFHVILFRQLLYAIIS